MLYNYPDHNVVVVVVLTMASENDVRPKVPSARSEDMDVVERLRRTMIRLAEAESNRRTFLRMLDVRNFVRKQADLKKTEHTATQMMVKTSMKTKLLDVCALFKQIRLEKKVLSRKLSAKMKQEKWRCKRIMKSLSRAARI